MMKRGISYRRVSTLEQAKRGFSLPTQAELNQAYADQNGITLVNDFWDDETGATSARDGWQQALEWLRSRRAEALVVIDNDRVFRNEVEYMLLRHELQERGIELHYSLRGGLVKLNDVGSQIVEDIHGRLAAEERRVTRERTMRGRIGKAKRGFVVSHGRHPYGYRLTTDKQQLEIFELEAETVRRIFRLYVVNGYSLSGIAELLTAEHVPTRSDSSPEMFPNKKVGPGVWGRSAVSHILHNTAYRGVWYYGKERVPVQVPVIVEDWIWLTAQARLEHNKETRRAQSENKYLLSGRIKCQCGGTILGHKTTYIRKDKTKGNLFYYRCANSTSQAKREAANCTAPQYRLDQVDTQVWEYLEDQVSNMGKLEEELKAVQAEQATQAGPLANEIEVIDGRLAKEYRKRDRLLDLFLTSDELDKAFYEANNQEINRNINNLELHKADV